MADCAEESGLRGLPKPTRRIVVIGSVHGI